MSTGQRIHGDWNQLAGSVKEKYGEVTDDDLRQAEGNIDRLIGIIQEKTGQAREQIEAFIDSIWQYTSDAGESARRGYQQVAQRAREGYRQSTEVLAQRPTESVLAAFGVGLLAGIAIGMAIAKHQQPDPSWIQRWRS